MDFVPKYVKTNYRLVVFRNPVENANAQGQERLREVYNFGTAEICLKSIRLVSNIRKIAHRKWGHHHVRLSVQQFPDHAVPAVVAVVVAVFVVTDHMDSVGEPEVLGQFGQQVDTKA